MDVKDLAQEIGVETLEVLPRDVSPRAYYRGCKDGRNFIVMRYPDVNPESKRELSEFIRIGDWLNAQGIKIAALYERNEEEGYALFEDLGVESFGKRLKSLPETAPELYKNAASVLKIIGKAKPLNNLPHYNDSRIKENRSQFVEYYMTLRNCKSVDDTVLESFLNVFEEIEGSLPLCPEGFVHGDYHLENLMYIDGEGGINQCALIDFQDALIGPLPYDLLNLLEDARIDVPENIKLKTQSEYCADMNASEKKLFMQWYRVLAVQFHCRVIGLFIKLSAEQNRDSYLIHIPRLQSYIQKSLDEPVLAPLKLWFEQQGVDFTPIKDLDGNHIRTTFENI